jgi:hypothetical protein
MTTLEATEQLSELARTRWNLSIQPVARTREVS